MPKEVTPLHQMLFDEFAKGGPEAIGSAFNEWQREEAESRPGPASELFKSGRDSLNWEAVTETWKDYPSKIRKAHTAAVARALAEGKQVPPSAAPAPPVVPPPAPKGEGAKDRPVPAWLKTQRVTLAAQAERSGMADKIEGLAAQRKTAKEIAAALGTEVQVVDAVRSTRGIPSWSEDMQGPFGVGREGPARENPEFTKWLAGRKPAPTPAAGEAPAKAAPKAEGAKEPKVPSVVYHGTPNEFETFEPAYEANARLYKQEGITDPTLLASNEELRKLGPLFFFSESEDVARGYADVEGEGHVKPVSLKAKRTFDAPDREAAIEAVRSGEYDAARFDDTDVMGHPSGKSWVIRDTALIAPPSPGGIPTPGAGALTQREFLAAPAAQYRRLFSKMFDEPRPGESVRDWVGRQFGADKEIDIDNAYQRAISSKPQDTTPAPATQQEPPAGPTEAISKESPSGAVQAPAGGTETPHTPSRPGGEATPEQLRAAAAPSGQALPVPVVAAAVRHGRALLKAPATVAYPEWADAMVQAHGEPIRVYLWPIYDALRATPDAPAGMTTARPPAGGQPPAVTTLPPEGPTGPLSEADANAVSEEYGAKIVKTRKLPSGEGFRARAARTIDRWAHSLWDSAARLRRLTSAVAKREKIEVGQDPY
ncbi:hypothetical protein KKH23_10645, partial [Patescibacteria group bacterium]|nr:hypothetical protein [Patescibacteria group bacterium]